MHVGTTAWASTWRTPRSVRRVQRLHTDAEFEGTASASPRQRIVSATADALVPRRPDRGATSASLPQTMPGAIPLSHTPAYYALAACSLAVTVALAYLVTLPRGERPTRARRAWLGLRVDSCDCVPAAALPAGAGKSLAEMLMLASAGARVSAAHIRRSRLPPQAIPGCPYWARGRLAGTGVLGAGGGADAHRARARRLGGGVYCCMGAPARAPGYRGFAVAGTLAALDGLCGGPAATAPDRRGRRLPARAERGHRGGGDRRRAARPVLAGMRARLRLEASQSELREQQR